MKSLSGQFIPLNPQSDLTIADCKSMIGRYFRANSPHLCIVEYLNLDFVLEAIPPHIATLLDTHDLVSRRKESFDKFGLVHVNNEDLSLRDELERLKKFDFVALISRQDFQDVYPHLDGKALLVPHSITVRRSVLRTKVSNVTFVGSEYPPNVHGIEWFIDNVWKTFRSNMQLHIVGRVAKKLSSQYTDGTNIFVHGFVADLDAIYAQADIVINPVVAGAGIKIKSLEAIAYSVPLVSSPHSAECIGQHAEQFCMTATHVEDWKEALTRLRDSIDVRRSLVEQARVYVEQNYSADKCYNEILRLL
ncbi:MAG TPA: glycosyltransferase family 4 protein [Chryseosolibacter sp.]